MREIKKILCGCGGVFSLIGYVCTALVALPALGQQSRMALIPSIQVKNVTNTDFVVKCSAPQGQNVKAVSSKAGTTVALKNCKLMVGSDVTAGVLSIYAKTPRGFSNLPQKTYQGNLYCVPTGLSASNALFLEPTSVITIYEYVAKPFPAVAIACT